MAIIELDSDAAFNELLNKPAFVIFMYSETTNPARKAYEHLAGMKLDSHTIFAIQPWRVTRAFEWIYNQPKLQLHNKDGNLVSLESTGALVWIRDSKVVDVEREVETLSLKQLESRNAV